MLSIAGPAIGALTVAAGSPAWAIAIDSVTFFASAALTASMHLAPTVRTASASILRDLREGWHEFVTRSWAVAIVVSFGLFQLTYFPALLVLGPLVAKQELGGVGAWGMILAVESAGAVVGGLFALRLRVKRPLVATQLLVLPAGLLLAALAVPVALIGIAAVGFAVGVGFALGNTLWITALQRNVPEHALSRISSFDWIGSVALNPIGYVLIGPIAAAIGTSETLAVAAVLNIAVCLSVVLVPSVRAIRMDVPSRWRSAADLGRPSSRRPQPSRNPPDPCRRLPVRYTRPVLEAARSQDRDGGFDHCSRKARRPPRETGSHLRSPGPPKLRQALAGDVYL